MEVGVPIRLSSVWLIFGPPRFHKNWETIDSSFTGYGHYIHYLFRWYFGHGNFARGGHSSFASYHRLIDVSWFSHKLWEISFFPSQFLEFLGLDIDTRNLKLSLPLTKVESILAQCNSLLDSDLVQLRNIARLLGNFHGPFPRCLSPKVIIDFYSSSTSGRCIVFMISTSLSLYPLRHV